MVDLAPPPADRLLADLNDAQREAVLATRGPLAILAAAGTGKTRVIARRTAYALATGVVAADQVLVVTFTDKAATEMVGRLAALGLRGVTARTFHAHALRQLRHFWPSRHGGRPLPQTLSSKSQLIAPIARRLPGHYRFTAIKDLADEVEWAKSRRIAPEAYGLAATDRRAPLPADLMAGLYRDYERAKSRANLLDFDDMLTMTVDILEADADAAELVRRRKSWFSVDEYQDTNPLQERLLELWAGSSPDICVVGDEDQTIYTFAGATPSFLTGFADRHPGARVVELRENYRSSPQVLELANRLLASDGRSKRLVATRGSGPVPGVTRHRDAGDELAALVQGVRRLIAGGTRASEVAILVRTNAQLAPIEEGLRRGGVEFRVRGQRFYDRPEVRAALDLLSRTGLEEHGGQLRAAVRAAFDRELGLAADQADEGDEAQERAAALETLLAILDDLVAGAPTLDVRAFVAALRDRARAEREDGGDGVNLLTYHRAKGLEWDAVFLPSLEEGSLPVRQNADDATIDEERRLLYVGITRARVHLALSWAERREVRGAEVRRRPSRFLEGLRPRPARRVVQLPDAVPLAGVVGGEGGAMAALRAWRSERARTDGVPAYVVAHDSTLLAIVEARPSSLAALRRVPGMGPVKLERYGAEILAALGTAE